MQPRLMLVLAGAMSLTATVSAAQGVGPFAPGARLRLTTAAGDRSLVGAFVESDEATLTLQAPGQKKAVAVRRDAVRKVEMSVGRHSRGRGALLGLGIGTGAGAALGAIMSATSSDEGDDAGAAAYGAMIIAPMLGALGAVVGLAVTPSEKWQELPLERVRVTFTPLRGRGGAVSVTWVF